MTFESYSYYFFLLMETGLAGLFIILYLGSSADRLSKDIKIFGIYLILSALNDLLILASFLLKHNMHSYLFSLFPMIELVLVVNLHMCWQPGRFTRKTGYLIIFTYIALWLFGQFFIQTEFKFNVFSSPLEKLIVMALGLYEIYEQTGLEKKYRKLINLGITGYVGIAMIIWLFAEIFEFKLLNYYANIYLYIMFYSALYHYWKYEIKSSPLIVEDRMAAR